MFEKTKNALIKLDNITVSFNEKTVIDNVSFEIFADQIVTLIGPNGAGKTTLLKTVLGIVRPDHGTVWKKSGLKIGYVPQKLNLSRSIPLTVARFLCLEKRYDHADLLHVLEETGADKLLSNSIHTLSGGEIQRVLLARTLLKQPELLVLDEPAQGLDPAGEEQFYALLSRLNKEKHCAILMVSHDLYIVMANTHRVLCLNHHICCSGSPDEIADSSDYRTLFGKGSPLAFYHHHHDHTHLPDGSICHVD
ncbi:MAG: metal ABC transporter ATP-binding protein [Alphaproteobacteria bacterium]|nr:metal ABC transporter ATP-binding protein [Alphaproteobacteria bacterium]